MRIDIKRISQVGNNAIAEMFFDDIRVATIHCTPNELERFITGLQGGQVLANFDQVVVKD